MTGGFARIGFECMGDQDEFSYWLMSNNLSLVT